MATHKNYSVIPFTSLLLSSLLLAACSSKPSPWSSFEQDPAADQAPVEEAATPAFDATPEQLVEEPESEPVVTAAATEELPVMAESSQVAATESAAAPAHNIKIKTDYPREYVVKKGDTLWGIASQFLVDPWYWPEIWYRNPQVDNPHMIYPGDKLSLTYINGQPTMQIARTEVEAPTATESSAVATSDVAATESAPSEERVERIETGQSTSDGRKVVRLGPKKYRTDRAVAIPTIPSDAIKQFLINPKVVTRHALDKSPYIVANDDAHLMMGDGNRVYVRDIYHQLDPDKVRYSVYRKGAELLDPQSDKILGYEIIYAGEARIDQYGDPSVATLINSKREIMVGDFLLDTDKSEFNHMYYPKVPPHKVDGRVISLFDALSSTARYQVVVINKGEKDGIEVGHVLASYFRAGAATDKYLARKKIPRGEEQKLEVAIPDQRSGLLMVFKVFDQVSYGLILDSSRPIRRNDGIRTPE